MKKYSREYPRVTVDCPLELILRSGEVRMCRMCNVSRAGLQILVDEGEADGITPGWRENADGLNIPVMTRFALPPPGEITVVEAGGLVAYVASKTGGGYLMGIRFNRFKDQGYKHLVRYILACLLYDE